MTKYPDPKMAVYFTKMTPSKELSRLAPSLQVAQLPTEGEAVVNKG